MTEGVLAPAQARLAAQELARRAGVVVGEAVRGHAPVVRRVLAAVLARGHVLLEDVPGVGKTTLARAVAQALGCSFSRLQCTADMLPADILGAEMPDPGGTTLSFHRGPIFAEVVLADELNRASPRAQSALLEAMAEGRVSIDGAALPLGPPFTVIATQNPAEHHGVYPLPESQLDRFMVRQSLGYPAPEVERELLSGVVPSAAALHPAAPAGPAALLAAQAAAAATHLSAPVADYILALVTATRRHPEIALGCSPRGALALAAMARAWALLAGRDFVLPDDVQEVAPAVLPHRLVLAAGATHDDGAAALVARIVANTAAPR